MINKNLLLNEIIILLQNKNKDISKKKDNSHSSRF